MAQGKASRYFCERMYQVAITGRYQTIDMCTDADPTVHYLDLHEYEQAHGNPTYFELRETIQPAHFLHLCYEGCGTDFYIDGNSSRIYLTAWCGSLPDSLMPNHVPPGKLRPESIIGLCWLLETSVQKNLQMCQEHHEGTTLPYRLHEPSTEKRGSDPFKTLLLCCFYGEESLAMKRPSLRRALLGKT